MKLPTLSLIVLALTVLHDCGTAWAELKVGAGRRVITPDPLLPVSGGLGPTAPVREKRGDLTARAVVFQSGETAFAVVALDLLGFPSVLCDRVRARVPRIPEKNLLIGSTHAHSAPDCYAFPDGKGGHTGDLKYMDFVCKQAAEAVNEAIDQLRPARLKVATDEARGKIAYNYYAPDLYDRRMSVIQAVDPAGKTIATLVNYAVHPEVLGPGVGILSPDLVGPLCDKIEAQAGGMAIFMNGAQGGMITADNRDLNRFKDAQRAVWHDDRTWDECLRIGHTMADEALRIVKDAPTQTDPKLFCDSINVKFPVENDVIWNVILGSPLKYPRNPDRSITTRINVVNLGNAQILTIPGEALPNIGFYLKRKMRGEHNLLFGLTNDAFGYILTKVDFHSFPRYAYVTRTSLGELTGEILIENSLAFVDKCPEPERLNRTQAANAADERRLLYVAVPGIRNLLEYGGHGVLVFDIDREHRFVKRIPTGGLGEDGKPVNVKGICASAATKRIYISTIKTLQCLDLISEKLLWEKPYEGGCDRMAISPDGKVIYLPSFEKDHWHAVDADSGDVMARIVPKSGAHNTVYGPSGNWAYLAGLRSPLLTVSDTNQHAAAKTVGPFSASIRPFTVNGRETLCFVNINELLGFEVGDLTTGQKLHRVEVQGFEKGPVKRHGCPSHGIGLTPDEKELWVTDATNQCLHIFDATVMPPNQVATIRVRDEPGWITFSIDGKFAYPSTGDIIETATRRIVTGLKDEQDVAVQSEKLLEIDFRGREPVRAGDQFGIGRIR